MGNIGSSMAGDITKQYDQRYYTRTDANTTFINVTSMNNAIASANTAVKNDVLATVRNEFKTQDQLQTAFDGRYATPASVASADTATLATVRNDFRTQAQLQTAFDSRYATADQVNTAIIGKLPTVYTKPEVDAFISTFRNTLGLPAESPFPPSTQTALPNV